MSNVILSSLVQFIDYKTSHLDLICFMRLFKVDNTKEVMNKADKV